MSSLIAAADKLRKALRPLRFPEPVACTYNPLGYAWDSHCQYLENFGTGQKRVLMLGMNPGSYLPFLQHGVNRLDSSLLPISGITR